MLSDSGLVKLPCNENPSHLFESGIFLISAERQDTVISSTSLTSRLRINTVPTATVKRNRALRSNFYTRCFSQENIGQKKPNSVFTEPVTNNGQLSSWNEWIFYNPYGKYLPLNWSNQRLAACFFEVCVFLKLPEVQMRCVMQKYDILGIRVNMILTG